MLTRDLLDSSLPEAARELPQYAVLLRAVEQLWREPSVVAIWLGGSFASGEADVFSDVDLRIAVRADDMESWRSPDYSALFGQSCVGHKVQAFGREAFLHHLMLEDGNIIDLFVQTTAHENPEHAIHIIAFRDDGFAQKLATFARPAAEEYLPADAAQTRQVIVEFWLNSQKHRRVLHRDLDVLLLTGLHVDRTTLARLWFTGLTGLDVGARRPTIHGMSRASKIIREGIGPKCLSILGARADTREAICAAIEQVRDEVAVTGRELASRLGFDYPDALEKTVRRSWLDFRSGM